MTDHTVVIRPATADDVLAIRAVAGRTWRATYAGLIADRDIEQFLDGAYSEEHLLRSIERFGAGFLVATKPVDVVGYAMAGGNRVGTGELFAIYVLPDCQRAGIGRELWAAAAGYLRKQGLSYLELWVLADNAPACQFYETQGAKPAGERDFTVGAGSVREIGYRFDLAVL